MKTFIYGAFALVTAIAVSTGSFAQTDDSNEKSANEDFVAQDFVPFAKCGCCTQGGADQTSPIIMALDLDKDGQISSVEIINAAQSLSALDADNDGKLTRHEMHANSNPTKLTNVAKPGNVSARKLGVTTRFMVRKMLKMFDKNGDQQLDKSEMSATMLTILPTIDRNGDEILTASELMKINQSIKERGALDQETVDNSRVQSSR